MPFRTSIFNSYWIHWIIFILFPLQIITCTIFCIQPCMYSINVNAVFDYLLLTSVILCIQKIISVDRGMNCPKIQNYLWFIIRSLYQALSIQCGAETEYGMQNDFLPLWVVIAKQRHKGSLTYRFFHEKRHIFVWGWGGGGVVAVTFLCKHHGKIR
jgi:hypothetical protein